MGNTNTVPIADNIDLENPENQNHDPPSTSSITEEEKEEEEDLNFTCQICTELMLSNKKFKNQNKCVHHLCTDCVAKYIFFEVMHPETVVIKCPELNCNELLDPLSCKTMISKNLFENWCDKLCESAIVGVNRCYCPHPTCSTLILNECGVINGPSTCPDCKRLFCFQCKMPWHTGYSCAESGTVRDVNDVLFGTLSETRKWARCPGCGHSVERTTGCGVITCRCSTQFCYNCGVKGNHMHRCMVSPLPIRLPERQARPAATEVDRKAEMLFVVGTVVVFVIGFICFFLLGTWNMLLQ